MSYLLDIATDDVADAMAHVGGLIFDLGRAGWHVRVRTDDPSHGRALRILGARPIAAGSGVEAPTVLDRMIRASPLPLHGLSPAAPRELHLHWRATGATDRGHPVEFRLSTAAQTFKAQALRCVGPTRDVEHRERFWADSALDGSPFAGCHPSIAVVG